MLKLKKPLPTRKRVIRVTSSEDKANRARWENDRNRTIASYYFNDTPTLPNLVKGTYYWIKGNIFGGSENPEDYKYIGGEAPIIGGPLRAVSSTGAKVLKEIVGKRPDKAVLTVNNGVKTFLRGVARGIKIGRKEGAELTVNAMQEKISRAYKLGVLRGTLTAERAAEKTAWQKTNEYIQSARKKFEEGYRSGRTEGAKILRRWLERSSRQSTPSTSTSQLATETPSLGFWGNTKRVLWETKNNNFGNSYKWRNAGRVPIFLSGFPYIAGSFFGAAPKYFEYAGESFAKGYKAGIGDTNQADSTNSLLVGLKEANPVLSDTIVPIHRRAVEPVTTSTQEELDSINRAWFRE